MLDAFDFFLVVFCLTAIGKEFHKSDAAVALSRVGTKDLAPRLLERLLKSLALRTLSI